MAAPGENTVVHEAIQLGAELTRTWVMLWLDTVVRLQLHAAGDEHGAELVRSLADRIEAGEPFGHEPVGK